MDMHGYDDIVIGQLELATTVGTGDARRTLMRWTLTYQKTEQPWICKATQLPTCATN